jgi:hypothetical protein
MSLASRKVSVDRADLGIRQLLVSPGLLRLPRLGQFRRVAFTNPFTDRGAELGLLNLPVLLIAAAPWPGTLGQGSRSDRAAVPALTRRIRSRS